MLQFAAVVDSVSYGHMVAVTKTVSDASQECLLSSTDEGDGALDWFIHMINWLLLVNRV